MKYITLFMLICLFFTVRTKESYLEMFEKCMSLEEEECKATKEKDGFNCCWAKTKLEGIDTAACQLMTMKFFEDNLEEAEYIMDEVSIDCSGKYLYAASLLLLLFVF